MKAKNLLVIVIAFAMMGLSAKGQLKFQKCIGGALGDDYGYCAKQTTDGGYIIAGVTNAFGAGANDVYLIKLNTNGDTMWTKTYGGVAMDYGNYVIQTNDGGYMIAGQTYNYIGNYDMFFIKTDANGDTLWTKAIGYDYVDNANAIQQTNDGGYIVAGSVDRGGLGYWEAAMIKLDNVGNVMWAKLFSYIYRFEAMDVHQTTDGGYILFGDAANAPHHFYLVKTDGNGDTLWTKYYGGPGVGDDYGKKIEQTSDHGYIMTGYTNGFSVSNTEMYVIKTDSMGVASWSKIYGLGAIGVQGNDLHQTADGGYIFGGLAQFSSYENCFLMKTNGSGIPTWSKVYGGHVGNSACYSMVTTSDGGYFMAGGNNSLGAGGSDVYLIKTDALGNSGCNDSSVTTLYSTPGTLLLSIVSVIDSVVVTANPSPSMSHGGTVSDLCNNVGIQEVVSTPSMVIAPNPFSTQATLTLQGTYHSPTLFIYNLLGQEVRSLPIGSNNQITIQRNNLPPGMYFYKVIEDNKEVLGVGKMLIE